MAKRVTLTFDNGPSPATARVLDTLHERDVRATFFACGDQLRSGEGRDLLRRAVDEGHWAGNHTMRQPHTFQFGTCADPDLPAREIGGTQELLGDLAHPDRLFRPPGGGGHLDERLLSPAAVEYLQQGSYTMVLWTSVPRDWVDVDGWVERCLADVERREWSVVVLHDLPTGAMEHLPRALEQLTAQGFEITQELPANCVPMRRGMLTAPIDHLVARSANHPTYEEEP